MQELSTKEQVQNYLERIGSSYSSGDSDLLESEKIFGERVSSLRVLKDTLYNTEVEFFGKILGNTNLSPKDALTELQRRVEEWNSSGAENLFNDKITSIVLEIMNNFYGVSLEQLQEAYTNNILITDLVPDLVINGGSENEKDNVLEKLYENINNLLSENKKTKFNKKVFFSKIDLEKKNGKYTIKFDEKISANYRRRFADIYNLTIKELNEQTQIQVSGTLEERINAALIKNGIKGEPLKKIEEEISNNLNKYAISYNFGVIKGFLGEVYWTAFFKYLSGNNNKVNPTGNIKNLKGQSIPIDLLIENYGFQVKNYIIKNGKVNLGLRNEDSRLMGSFILNRAEVAASEALLLFFGAWGYNRPTDYATEEYKNLYNSFPENFATVDKIFQAHVDKIIGIDKKFAQKQEEGIENLFPDEEVHYNNFFLVNNKIIPASEIVQGIIEGFEESAARVKFIGEYKRRDVDENKLWPKGNPSSLENAANLVTINYQVLINVEDILNKAYNNF